MMARRSFADQTNARIMTSQLYAQRQNLYASIVWQIQHMQLNILSESVALAKALINSGTNLTYRSRILRKETQALGDIPHSNHVTPATSAVSGAR